MRARYQLNRDIMTEWVQRYFPAVTRISRPQGGFLLWIELPPAFDTLRLNRQLESKGVQVSGGAHFLRFREIPPLPAPQLRQSHDPGY